jgi:hypothetical protein
MRTSTLSIVVVALVCVAACGTTHERATAHVPDVFDPGMSIAIERTSMHAYLAEYRRALIVDKNGKESARLDLFQDTGGYSRVNLYRSSIGDPFVRDTFASYKIDLITGTIAKDEKRRAPAAFLGSFDVDSAGQWSFIVAAERAELPTELAGGS